MIDKASSVASVRFDEPLAAHTSWRVGGAADVFFTPRTVASVTEFLAHRVDGPLFWLGLGSNVLVRDGGVRGTVIATAGGLLGLAVAGDDIYAEAGVPLAKVARFAVDRGYQGLEFFAGIPGTVGGALAMNAGASGSETWNFVTSVETIDRAGVVRVRTPRDFTIRYRHVEGPFEEWFLAARFHLQQGDPAFGRQRIKEYLAIRNKTQPMQTANAGSVFRNPPGDFAARLIEHAGLKGVCEGGARVSARHANFIINEGHAKACDIERLIARIQARVQECAGIVLEPEVRIVGDPL